MRALVVCVYEYVCVCVCIVRVLRRHRSHFISTFHLGVVLISAFVTGNLFAVSRPGEEVFFFARRLISLIFTVKPVA